MAMSNKYCVRDIRPLGEIICLKDGSFQEFAMSSSVIIHVIGFTCNLMVNR